MIQIPIMTKYNEMYKWSKWKNDFENDNKAIFFILALDQPHFTKMKFTSQENDLFILNLEHYLFLISKMRSLQVLWGFFKHADGVTAFANAKSKIWQTFSVLLRESGQGKKFLLLLKWSIRHETNCKRLVALRSPLNLALREDLGLGSQK